MNKRDMILIKKFINAGFCSDIEAAPYLEVLKRLKLQDSLKVADIICKMYERYKYKISACALLQESMIDKKDSFDIGPYK